MCVHNTEKRIEKGYMDAYVPFEHCTFENPTGIERKTMEQAFRRDARLHGLGDLLQGKRYQSQLRLSFYRAMSDGHLNDVWLVFVIGNNDGVLRDLGTRIGLPRGFPILWKQGAWMQYYGFYSKFDNDQRAADVNDNDFRLATQVTITPKYSGFLSQVLTWKVDGQSYFTVVSKNSADHESQYVRIARDMLDAVMPHVMHEYSQRSERIPTHFCFETVSQLDQVHGTRVCNEACVLLAAGHGYLDDLTQDFVCDSNEMPDFVEFERIRPFESTTINGMRLIVPASWVVRAQQDGRVSLHEFMCGLLQRRDSMTTSSFLQYMQETVSQGCMDVDSPPDWMQNDVEYVHGDCLEGLVVCFNNSHQPNIVERKKIKFPNYTIRTMLLRDIVENWYLTQRLLNEIRTYVHSWCITEPGRRWWSDFAARCFIKCATGEVPTTSDTNGPAAHILLAEQVGREMPDLATMNEYQGDAVEQLGTILENAPTATVIIVLLPESQEPVVREFMDTILGAYQNLSCNGMGVEPIYADRPLGDALTDSQHNRLSAERVPVICWQIVSAVACGRIPIVFTNGRSLCGDTGKMPCLLHEKMKMINVDYRLIGIVAMKAVPSGFPEGSQVIKLATSQGQDVAGKMRESYKENSRSASREMDMLRDFFKFAPNVAKACNVVYGVIPGPLGQEDVCFLTNGICENPPFCTTYRVTQIRLLTDVVTPDDEGTRTYMGHITVSYSAKPIKITDEFLDGVRSKYDQIVNGREYTMVGEQDEHPVVYRFAMPEKAIHADMSTHITMNCGDHAPKETGVLARSVVNGEKSAKILRRSVKGQETEYVVDRIRECRIHVLHVFCL